MKNFSVVKKIIFCVTLVVIEVILYMCVDRSIQVEKSNRPYISTNEFLQTIDCAGVFNTNPEGTYVIEFDIRAEVPGRVLVYQQNGTTARYAFHEYVDVTEEYQTMRIVVNPILVDAGEEKSILAFYGEYGSGVIPEVRKISVKEIEE